MFERKNKRGFGILEMLCFLTMGRFSYDSLLIIHQAYNVVCFPVYIQYKVEKVESSQNKVKNIIQSHQLAACSNQVMKNKGLNNLRC